MQVKLNINYSNFPEVDLIYQICIVITNMKNIIVYIYVYKRYDLLYP